MVAKSGSRLLWFKILKPWTVGLRRSTQCKKLWHCGTGRGWTCLLAASAIITSQTISPCVLYWIWLITHKTNQKCAFSCSHGRWTRLCSRLKSIGRRTRKCWLTCTMTRLGRSKSQRSELFAKIETSTLTNTRIATLTTSHCKSLARGTTRRLDRTPRHQTTGPKTRLNRKILKMCGT